MSGNSAAFATQREQLLADQGLDIKVDKRRCQSVTLDSTGLRWVEHACHIANRALTQPPLA